MLLKNIIECALNDRAANCLPQEHSKIRAEPSIADCARPRGHTRTYYCVLTCSRIYILILLHRGSIILVCCPSLLFDFIRPYSPLLFGTRWYSVFLGPSPHTLASCTSIVSTRKKLFALSAVFPPILSRVQTTLIHFNKFLNIWMSVKVIQLSTTAPASP